MLLVRVVVARFLSDWTPHCLVLLLASYWRWVVTKWNIAFCFSLVWANLHGQPVKKKNLASSSSPQQWHVITSDFCFFAFVVVDLTWSTFCVHIFRRQLQTNMAVRLCDVASLLRSGSWAPEPWTGVCGTSFLNSFSFLSQCSGHTNNVSSLITVKSNSLPAQFENRPLLGFVYEKLPSW